MKTEKAEVTWEYENGQLAYEQYRLNGNLHNPNGPAFRSWYDNGQLKSEEYHINGNLHNPNGPAIRYWYKDGQLQYESYRLNGKIHNPNGPAYREWYENGQLASEEYWLNGEKLTKEQFEKRKNSCDCEGKVIEIEGKKYELKLVS